MSATYADWNQVPAHIEAKIRKIWSGSGCATYDKGWDRNNDAITIYKLSDYNVALNADYLTTEQKLRMFDIALQKGIPLDSFLHSLRFEPECIRVRDEIYHVPGIIHGTWPHCGLYGGMDESGYVHT
jgi:hypothetical protein